MRKLGIVPNMTRLVLFAILCCRVLNASGDDGWVVATDPHFQIYSQSGEAAAQRALVWFQQLRTFFQQNRLFGDDFTDQAWPVLRIIGFRSEKEYEEYRLRPAADAYYTSDGNLDYIVMPALQPRYFATAAHEYAHYVVHAAGLKLSDCLNEGLAEFFSTLQATGKGYSVGGDLPARTQVLRRERWMPMAALLNFSNRSSSSDASQSIQIFYAQSWALVDMLITSPLYSDRFRDLLLEFGAGSNPLEAFQKVYKKSLDDIAESLENWVRRPRYARPMPAAPPALAAPRIAEMSDSQTSSLLAQLLLVDGRLDRARTRYEERLRERPDDPSVHAALGTIALRQGDREQALKYWRRAVTEGIEDPELCYRYALLAEEADQKTPEVKAALERAVALSPDFDDARYNLALLEKSAGDYQSAVEHLRAMRVPSGARRFAYWIALASALTELDRRDEAQKAAQQAMDSAHTDAERVQARQLAYIAATDLTVQFSTDAQGRPQMVTARVPHGTADWNPFIEPSDRIQHASGKLQEVLCTHGKLTGFLVRTGNGAVPVEVPDPLHVLIRNGPEEFFCGPIQEKEVEADYAVVNLAGKTINVLRGMTFENPAATNQ